MKKIAILLSFSIAIILSSCLTPKEEPVEEVVPAETIPEETVDSEVIEAETIETEPIESEEYVVTEEEYEETFIQVEDMITQLNDIISRADYNTWMTYLSQDYIEKYGSKDFLTELSNNPVLKEYDIKLKSLKDYFSFVVVPSRSNIKVDEIQFLTEDTIIAYMYKENSKFVVYQLLRKGSSWIITD